MRSIRLVLIPALVVGLAAIGAVAAFADSGTTQLSVTVPSSISMIGPAATYTASIPAGTTGNIDTPVTISTNNSSGYSLTIAAVGANFHSAVGGYDFGIDADTLGLGATPVGPLTQAGTVVKNSTGMAAGDVIAVRQSIAVPGNQPGGVYSVTETFTAIANP